MLDACAIGHQQAPALKVQHITLSLEVLITQVTGKYIIGKVAFSEGLSVKGGILNDSLFLQ